MTRMTGPGCAVMCNLINTHTHTHSVKVSRVLPGIQQVSSLKKYMNASKIEDTYYLPSEHPPSHSGGEIVNPFTT